MRCGPRAGRHVCPPILLIALLSTGATLPARAQQVVDVSDLGSLGGNHVAAYAINQAGLIVGASLDGRPEKIAFVKPPSAPMLGLLADEGTRKAYSEARDVNASGQVLLFHAFRSAHWDYDVYLWTAAGGLTVVSDGVSDEPVGLDDRGHVVANSVVERTELRSAFEARRTAVVFEAPGRDAVRLPELSAEASRGTRAHGVNGRGDVVGEAPDARGASWPVLWDAEGRALHVLPSALRGAAALPGRARALNDAGTIVGELDEPRATNPDGSPCDAEVSTCVSTHVVVWRGPEHALTDLGPGTVDAINAHDVAVGDRLWDVRRGRVVALPADGDDALLAHDINDDDVLVGERGLRAVRARYVP